MHYLNSRKGFTLIELLIVVAIIAILAAIAVPNFLEAQTRAKTASIKSDMRSLATALESYYVDHNNYVPAACVKSGGYNYPEGSNTTMHVGDQITGHGGFFYHLSTPVAYIANSFIKDPFTKDFNSSANYNRNYVAAGYVKYIAFNKDRAAGWTGKATKNAYRGQPSSFCDRGNWNAAGNPQILWWTMYSYGPDEEQGTFSLGKKGMQYWDEETYLEGFKDNSSFSEEECEEMMFNAIVNNVYDPTNGTKSLGNIWRLGGGRPSGTRLNEKYDNGAFTEEIYEALAATSD